MAAYRSDSNQPEDLIWCKYCEHTLAEHFCKNCGDNMCSQCHVKHMNHSSFLNHETLPYVERKFARERFHVLPKLGESARKKMKTNLKRKKGRQSRVTSFKIKGTMFGNIQDFKQIKEKLGNRALELKSCVENILSERLAEVERLEKTHQTSVQKYVSRLRRGRCTQNLNSMGPIELALYEEKNMNWNQTGALQGLRILRFNPKPFKEDDISRLFGGLSFKETNTEEKMTDVLDTRPHTTEPRPLSQELQLPRIPVPHTDRSHTVSRRPISGSFVSADNMNRYTMGVCESPIQIKEFKSSINILFQITYSEQLSGVFISGDKPTIYTYKNVLKVCNVESKLKVLDAPKEPQGLTIGLTGNLVYSDGFDGVVEVINANQLQQHSVIKLQHNSRIIFNKKGYTAWGVHCTKSGEFLVCIIPNSERDNYAAVVRIALNITHSQIVSECEYSHKSSGEPLFSHPRFVCENSVTNDICVSDIKSKVIVLSSSGDFRFSYKGIQTANLKLTTFAPRGIACTGKGHILVADVENDLVHMLQSNGQFITHILSSTSLIFRPWGICVDTVDRIWLVEEQKNEGGVKCLAKVKVFQIYENGS